EMINHIRELVHVGATLFDGSDSIGFQQLLHPLRGNLAPRKNVVNNNIQPCPGADLGIIGDQLRDPGLKKIMWRCHLQGGGSRLRRYRPPSTVDAAESL